MSLSPPIPQLNQDVLKFVEAEVRSNSAIIIYDNNDRIVWANGRQRSIADVTDYASETHSSLFWLLVNAGKIGARVDLSDPVGWLERARITRRQGLGMSWLSEYPSCLMSVSHRNFQDGYCVQSRNNFEKSEVDAFFSFNCSIGNRGKISREQDFLAKIDGLTEASSVGICTVNSNMEIIHANNIFNAYVDGGNEISVNNGIIEGKSSFHEFNSLISRAIESVNFKIIVPCYSQSGVMSISSGNFPRTAMIVVSFPWKVEIDTLREALGINPAEAAVAALIGAGLSPAEIAKSRSTTEVTIYTQIRNLKEKIRKFGFPVSDLVGLSKLISRISSVTHLWK